MNNKSNIACINNGYGFNLILGIYEPFTDNWIWGTLGEEYGTPPNGNCDGTDLTSDGSNEIQFRLNHPVVTGQGSAYTDLETREMTGFDFFDENFEPLLYVGNDFNHCMNISELTDNLINADGIIKTYDDVIDPNTGYPMGLRPHGKDFIKTKIFDTVIVNTGDETFLHYYEVTYGIPFTITH